MSNLLSTIADRKAKQTQHKEYAENEEFEIVAALWNARGEVTLKDMTSLSGWSKQTIYNKWRKYGYNL